MGSVNKIKEASMYYVTKFRLPILPLCPPNHINMSRGHRINCQSMGKAPVIQWKERTDTTTADVEKWFARNEYLNVGLILGKTDYWNLVGIDIDGEVGERLLSKYSKGQLPATWEFTTGNGRRLLYLLPEGASSHKHKINVEGSKGELALIATGQQTVIPPSRHPSGVSYAWVQGRSPEDIDIALAPDWILDRVLLYKNDIPSTIHESADGFGDDADDYDSDEFMDLESEGTERVTEEDFKKVIQDGNRNNHLVRLVGSLVAKGNLPKELVISTAMTWNNEHCIPPLPRERVVTTVNSIWEAENSKKQEKRKKVSVAKFNAISFSLNFMKKERERGIYWKYIVKRGVFYRYDSINPPWKVMDLVYIKKVIAEYLIDMDEELATTRNVNEVIDRLREFLANQEEEDVFDLGDNPDKLHVYCDNGILDWQTDTLQPWDATTYSTIKLPVKWNPEVRDGKAYQLWVGNLQEWIPDELARDFIQEFIGYCLIPDCRFRTAVFLHGGGSNGKSLFIDIVSSIFRGHLTNIGLKRISQRFDTVRLLDQLVNICSDIDDDFIRDTSILKRLIAGDTVTGEYKGGKIFEFPPIARLIFSANSLPKVKDKSFGWYSRWQIIDFPRQFAKDPQYYNTMTAVMSTDEAKSAILLWAVDGLKRLMANNKFTTSEFMETAIKEYQAENDNVAAFMGDVTRRVLDENEDTRLVTTSLFEVYQEWCQIQGLKPLKMIMFIKRVSNLGYNKQRRPWKAGSKKRVTCFLGVTMKNSETIDYEAVEAYRENELMSGRGKDE